MKLKGELLKIFVEKTELNTWKNAVVDRAVSELTEKIREVISELSSEIDKLKWNVEVLCKDVQANRRTLAKLKKDSPSRDMKDHFKPFKEREMSPSPTPLAGGFSVLPVAPQELKTNTHWRQGD